MSRRMWGRLQAVAAIPKVWAALPDSSGSCSKYVRLQLGMGDHSYCVREHSVKYAQSQTLCLALHRGTSGSSGLSAVSFSLFYLGL
jgi:hypothetical protein